MNNLKIFNKVLLFKTMLFLFLCTLPGLTASGAEINILDSSTKSVTIEFTSSDIQVSEKVIAGKVYQDIHIPGTGWTQEPGKPKVPFRGALLAVPPNSDIQIDVLDFEVETRQGYIILPSPFLDVHEEKSELRVQESFMPDKETYKSDSFQPESPVKIGNEGYIRSQRVAQIKFFPVLYNPVRKEIKLYKKILAQVTFTDNSKAGAIRGAAVSKTITEDSAGFHRMLKGILINDKDSNRVFKSIRLNAAPSCPPLTQSFSVKIFIEQDGIYSLTYNDFLSYGIDMSSIDPRQIQMTHQGMDVPILITGESDGIFDPGDEITFYGEAMTGDYTQTNVYWLSINPAGGSRMALLDGTPGAGTLLTSFRTTEHEEENNIYWSYMPNGAGKDHWFWDDLYGGQSFDMIVNLNNVAATSETATVRVMLYGKTDDYVYNPDHHTKVLLNGVEIHDAWWNGQGAFLHEVDISHASLLEGANTVTLQSMGDTGAVVDIVYINYVEIDYRDSNTAESDKLRFDGEGYGQYNIEVNGFTQQNIDLYDITDPHNVASIIQTDIQPDGQGGYFLSFGDTISGEKTYTALTPSPSQYLKPVNMENDSPSILKDACNRADYIIIYHDSFDVTGLSSALSGRGLEVLDVKISDVYDEFSYGIFNPQAIKDFLTYAYDNYEQPRPSYVLLVGDANQDYMNNYGYGINYVPTHLFQTYQLGDTASDNWFVSVSGEDSFPDMFLGRVSVRTQAELDGVVSKIVNYELDVPVDGWNQSILMVADDETIFEDMSDRLIQDYLDGYNANKVYLSQYSIVDNATQDIIDYIDAGSILTNYTGHGSVDNWAGENMFESSYVVFLNNPDRFTFVVTLNCLNGWFSYYKRNYTLSEEFLIKNQKGAIGLWSPTGLGYSSEHEILARELFNDLFINKEVELGPLTTGAKISAVANYGVSTDNLEIYTLFGEPTTRLQIDTSNIPPAADPDGPYTGIEGQAITLDGSGSSDADGTIILYEWDIDNNGTYDYSSSLPTQSHTYAQQGIYTIRLRVTDNIGATDEATTTATTSDTSPTASFTGTPTGGAAPLTVDFTNTSTGYDQPLTYAWDFDNDGTTDSTATNPSYTYNSPGTYTVKLTVTDSDSSTDTQTRMDYITVTNLPVRIGSIYYSTLQSAYNAAANGDTIQSQAVAFIENLNVDRNISVTIEGGYNSDYTAKTGDTTLKGTMTLSNGTLTIEEFILSN